MDNIFLASNNNGTQSSIHGGEADIETVYRVPMEIKDEANQRTGWDKEDHDIVK
jgi:hypothetical protein